MTINLANVVTEIENLNPRWLEAAFGAAAAGALVFPARRVLAAAVGAGGVVAFALWRNRKPCCSSCANGGGCEGAGNAAAAAALYGDVEENE